MASSNAAIDKAMRLAAVSGMRWLLGPALLAASENRPERQNLAMAAMGEMLIDKLPFLPNRTVLPMLLPRAVAGAWVTKKVLEEEGSEDPWAPVMGAAVAVGVATFAPVVRNTLRHVLGVPDAVLGMAEDYLALRLGSEAVGMSMNEVTQIAGDSVDEMKNRLIPEMREPQSTGAGSM